MEWTTLHVDAVAGVDTVPEVGDGRACEHGGEDDCDSAADDEGHDGLADAAPFAFDEETQVLVQKAEFDEDESGVVDDDGDVQHLQEHGVVLWWYISRAPTKAISAFFCGQLNGVHL